MIPTNVKTTIIDLMPEVIPIHTVTNSATEPIALSICSCFISVI